MKRLALIAALCLGGAIAIAQEFPIPLLNGPQTVQTLQATINTLIRNINAIVASPQNTLGTTASLTSFGARCDGTSDDAAAFAAATTWMSAAANRIVTIPAGSACATTTTVEYGDGRQHSTTLTGAASGTTVAVASCDAVVSGDAVAVKRNDGTLFTTTTTGCAALTLTLAGAYSGGTASSGNAVFTGKISSYNGGGFRGYGACDPNGTVTPVFVSQIKYIGTASPSTTLGANATIGATSLTVASIAGINIGEAIGVALDDASVFWTWVTETPTGTTVKIGNEIPSLGTSGNAVRVQGSPVARINGPIVAPVFEGVCVHANDTQAVGLEVRHVDKGKFQGVGGISAVRYTGVGHYIHSGEFYAGSSTGAGDTDFELHAFVPQNEKTVGCWLRGTGAQDIAFSRNRFHGGTCSAGGKNLRAAGLLIEFIDNNTFIKPYTSIAGNGFTAGAGLYRQPSLNKLIFPNENEYLGPAFVGGITDGTATGGTLGSEHITAFAVYDGESLPTSQSLSGTQATGLPFGFGTPKDYFAGLKLTRLNAVQIQISAGMATDSTGNTILKYSPGLTTCPVSLNASGDQGIDVGSKAANTWYAVFLTGNYSTGGASCIMTATTSAAVPIPTLSPATFQFYAYVGRFKTDGSSNIDALTVLPRGQFYVDASDTYTPGASGFRPRAVRLLACGGGASGGSGGRQVSGTAISGGVGGSGGGCMDITYPLEQMASTVAVTVGAGGLGVSAPGTNSTAGVSGNPGNPTFFGVGETTAIAYGGAGCSGDGGQLNATAASGGAGAGAINTLGGYTLCAAGASGVVGNAMVGGQAGSAVVPTPTVVSSGSGGAGGASTTSASSFGAFGGNRFSCPGGGAGGAVTSAPAAVDGGNGGRAADAGVVGVAGGTVGTPSPVPAVASTMVFNPGNAGGGGYGNSAGAAGNGSAGAQCAGGGGGGSTLNGSTAGNSGAGGSGYAFVWELL